MVPDLCTKFQPCIIYGFWVTGIETEEQKQQQQQQQELQEWIFHTSPMQMWILIETESDIEIFQMYGIDGAGPAPSL